MAEVLYEEVGELQERSSNRKYSRAETEVMWKQRPTINALTLDVAKEQSARKGGGNGEDVKQQTTQQMRTRKLEDEREA